MVPDTIDDIVADIGQEEKEEGKVHELPHHPFIITVLQGKESETDEPKRAWRCVHLIIQSLSLPDIKFLNFL